MRRRLTATMVMAAALLLPAKAWAQAEKIEAGKKIYTTLKCGTCHSVGGAGGKLASKLDEVGTKLTPAEIKAWIVNPDPLTAKIKPAPKMKMKKYTLPDADLDALITYLASLKK
jgi:mono/diheme cytochrome c family protein